MSYIICNLKALSFDFLSKLSSETVTNDMKCAWRSLCAHIDCHCLNICPLECDCSLKRSEMNIWYVLKISEAPCVSTMPLLAVCIDNGRLGDLNW